MLEVAPTEYVLPQPSLYDLGQVSFDSIIPQDLDTKQREILSALDNPTAQVWANFEQEGSLKEAVARADQVVVLMSGLASSHDQWNWNQSSFIGNYTARLEQQGQTLAQASPSEGARPKVLFVSINQIGFGTSVFNSGAKDKSANERKSLVSDENNAEYLYLWLRALGYEPAQAAKWVIIGHSAGGEAACKFALKRSDWYDGAIYALNPAVGIDKQNQFTGLAALTTVGTLTPAFITELVTKMVIMYFTGADGSIASSEEVRLHLDEATKNPEAFLAKLQELAEVDKHSIEQLLADANQQAESLLRVSSNLMVLFAEKDILTPQHHILAWHSLAMSLLSQALGKMGITLDSTQVEFSQPRTVPNAHHDSVFVSLLAQAHYLSTIMQSLARRAEQRAQLASILETESVESRDVLGEIEEVSESLPATPPVLVAEPEHLRDAVGTSVVEKPERQLPAFSEFFKSVIRQLQADGCVLRIKIHKQDGYSGGIPLLEMISAYQTIENPTATYEQLRVATEKLGQRWSLRSLFSYQLFSNFYKLAIGVQQAYEQQVAVGKNVRIVIPKAKVLEFLTPIFMSESVKLVAISTSEEAYVAYQKFVESLRNGRFGLDVTVLGLFVDKLTNSAFFRTAGLFEQNADNPKLHMFDLWFKLLTATQSDEDVELSPSVVAELTQTFEGVSFSAPALKQIVGSKTIDIDVDDPESALLLAKVLANESNAD